MSQADEADEMCRLRECLVLWSHVPEGRLEAPQGVLRKEMKILVLNLRMSHLFEFDESTTSNYEPNLLYFAHPHASFLLWAHELVHADLSKLWPDAQML